MKVFISWSGERSKAIADELKEWIPNVVQTVVPWFSPQDINKGSEWFTEIIGELKQTDAGIFVLTQENLHSMWMNFEAGAVRAALERSRVLTVLVGLTPAQVPSPWLHFMHTIAKDRSDMLALIESIRPDEIPATAAAKSFEKFWPDLEVVVMEQVAKGPPENTPSVREPAPVTDEILQIVRRLEAMVGDLPARDPRNLTTAPSVSPTEAIAQLMALIGEGGNIRRNSTGAWKVALADPPHALDAFLSSDVGSFMRAHDLDPIHVSYNGDEVAVMTQRQ